MLLKSTLKSIPFHRNIGYFIAVLGLVLVQTGKSDTITLTSGDVLHGKVKKQTEGAVVFEHPDLGKLEIITKRIRDITIAKDPSHESQVELHVPEHKKSVFTKLKDNGWKFNIDLSLDASYGNTDEQSTRVGSKVEKKTSLSSLLLDASYYNTVKSGDNTDNKFTAGVLRKWLNEDTPWFLFTSTRYDYDEFESWDHRAAAHVGPGYRLIEKDSVSLNLLVGAGARKEWGSLNEDIKFEGLGGVQFDWQISKKQSFDLGAFIIPVYSDFDDYRTRLTMNWRYRLDQEARLHLLVGVLNEYQSIVDPGNDKNDLRVYSGIQFGF